MSTQVSTISPQQLHEVKRRGRYAPVLDVRSVAEYRTGHIPGAQLIPIESLSDAWHRPDYHRHHPLVWHGQADHSHAVEPQYQLHANRECLNQYSTARR